MRARALEAAGKPFPAEFPGRRECFVARTRDEAIRLCRPYLAKKYEVYHAWGQDKAMPEGDNDLGLDFDELIKDRFFLGGPDEVAQQIVDYTRKTGINHHILSCQWPGMPQNLVLDTLQLLAEALLAEYVFQPGRHIGLIALAIAAAGVFCIGLGLQARFSPARFVLERQTGRELFEKPVHSMYWIRAEYWGLLYLCIAYWLWFVRGR